ncbi:MAG: WalW protein, partial [Alphaproteobacteria bacterium]
YPVATKPEGIEPLLAFRAEDRCQIGAHIHPWVNPPYEEAVSGPNSFILNLAPALQRSKLTELQAAIAERLGTPPVSFKAGRYGLGRDTVSILDDLGFEIDWSISPAMDFRESGGPSFVDFDANPFFLTRELLEIPCTIDYVGWLGSLRPGVHRLVSRPLFEPLRMVGIMSRLGAVNRVMLTPEGNSFEEMRSLVRSLFARGCRVFTMSFHSPSADVGHTPYVRSQADLQNFLQAIERFCEFFMRDMEGVAISPQSFRHQVATMAES